MKRRPIKPQQPPATIDRGRRAGHIPTTVTAIAVALLAIILLGCSGSPAPTQPTENAVTTDGTAQPKTEAGATATPAKTGAPAATAEPATAQAPTPQATTPGENGRATTPPPRPTAAPAATPQESETQATPAPAEPSPASQVGMDEMLEAVARHFGITPEDESTITVESWEAVSWADGSMGCPKAGFAYAQAIIPGYRIVLNHKDQKVSVHTDETGRQAKLAVNCASTPGRLWYPRTPRESPFNLPEPTPIPEETARIEPAGGTSALPPQHQPVDMAKSSQDSMASATASGARAAPQSGQPRHPWPPRPTYPRRPRGPDATFEAHPRQLFVQASQDPMSTFSLDVDTTSYHLAVGWTRQGIRIDRDSVRAEEWVNALHYGYAPPENDDEFAITSGLYPHPLGGNRRVARITTKAPEATSNAPLNVTLVLDASGSMAEGNRVAIARRAAETIRASLDEKDRIAVVHFTTDVVGELTIEHTHPDAGAVRKSIDALIPRGSTNVQAGLNLGVSLADRARADRPQAHNYVILMSDGVANVDATNPFAILETAYDENALNPLRLVTIGVGISNYNDPLLETLAQHGNGWYRYLSSTHEAEETFRKENWLALSTPFADQTRAQVTWNGDAVDRWRIIGYENRVTDDESFTEDRREFAELHAGVETTIFYELDLNRRVNLEETLELGSIELRWVNPNTGESTSQTAPVTGRADAQYDGPEGEKALLGATTAVFADIYGAKPGGSHPGREELWDLEMLADLLLYVNQESRQMRDHLDLLYGVINHMRPKVEITHHCRWGDPYRCPYPYPDCQAGMAGPCVDPGHPPQVCLGPSGPCYEEK